MRPKGQAPRGELWLSETELRSKFAIKSTRGVRGQVLSLSPLKWLEIHLKLTWCGEIYTISNKKRLHKINFTPQNA